MARLIPTLLLGLLLPAVGQADLYVKRVAHSTSYVDGEVVGTRQGDASEMWIGAERLASHEGNKTILLDLKRNLFCILNHPDKCYIEAPLPLDLTKILSDDLLSRYETVRTSGKVEEEDGSLEVLSSKCRCYRVSYWDVSDGQRRNERTVTVWATEDVDFDEAPYARMLECMRMLHNRDKKLRKELKKIKGLQIRYEITGNGSGVKSRLVSEVVELKKLDPPEGVYMIPEDYTRKERLDDHDF